MESIAILFIIMLIGYLAYRVGFLDRSSTHGLSSFLLNVTLPALIISAMQIPVSDELIGQVITIFQAQAVFYVISFAFAFCIPLLLPGSVIEKGVMRFLLVFSNLGFTGIPVSIAFFGEGAVFYSSLFMIPFNFLAFSIGILMLRPDLGHNIDPKVFVNPGIVASVIGLLLFFTGLSIPSPFIDAIDLLGGITTPLSMIVIGAVLATMPATELFTDWRVYVISFCRLLLIPTALYLCLSPFITDPLLLAIPVLLAGMPCATSVVLFAEEYEVASSFASQGVFISTIFSIITIPIIALLFF